MHTYLPLVVRHTDRLPVVRSSFVLFFDTFVDFTILPTATANFTIIGKRSWLLGSEINWGSLSKMHAPDTLCAICSADQLHHFKSFSALPRVTSDSRPFASGGKLAMCQSCGALQKIADKKWLSEIESIYADFAIYHQADGAEQLIFDATGGGEPRSERLLAVLVNINPATVLDFGCGNGATLRAMSRCWPQSELSGAELGSKNESRLRAIPNFKKLYTCSPEKIESRFDLITLVHSLEHLVWPVSELKQLCTLLTATGQIFVQVPDCAQNPYDLVVADHRLHFTVETLEVATSEAGLTSSTISDSAVVKELSYLGHPNGKRVAQTKPSLVSATQTQIEHHLSWLADQIGQARTFASSGRRFGIFGSSISATWLAGSVAQEVGFFVDEDLGRVGRTHMGRPIVAIDNVPSGAIVLVPLIPRIAQSVLARLKSRGIACQ